MAWWFGALAHSAQRQLRRARSFEKEQEKRLLEAYARACGARPLGGGIRSGRRGCSGVTEPAAWIGGRWAR